MDHLRLVTGARAPILAAALGLAGSLAVMLVLHRSATATLDRMLTERLSAAGEAAALLVRPGEVDSAMLAELMRVNALDGAFVVDRRLTLVADATGQAPRPASLLRVDPDRVAAAFEGRSSVATSFALDELTVLAGYFPLRDPNGTVVGVLGLEAGEAFAEARREPRHALWLGLVLAAIAAGGLALAALAWDRAERTRRQVEARAARAEMVSGMAAVAAHEIRNPLAVIRGTVDLALDRAGTSLPEKVRSAMADVLAEVARLKGLTDDLLDLSADRTLATAPVQLASVLEEAARAAEAAHAGISVDRRFAPRGSGPQVMGDATRLRQVFSNLLDNAAHAQGSGAVVLELAEERGAARVVVRDEGPGVPPELRERIFEPFFTTRAHGTGLGLALARRLVERHGGSTRLLETARGTAIEVRLPLVKETT